MQKTLIDHVKTIQKAIKHLPDQEMHADAERALKAILEATTQEIFAFHDEIYGIAEKIK